MSKDRKRDMAWSFPDRCSATLGAGKKVYGYVLLTAEDVWRAYVGLGDGSFIGEYADMAKAMQGVVDNLPTPVQSVEARKPTAAMAAKAARNFVEHVMTPMHEMGCNDLRRCPFFTELDRSC